MKKIIAILLLLMNTHALADPVADFLNSYMKRKTVPGVAVMVRKDGAVVLSQGYGYSNLEHNVPVKPQTVFQSGSIGKQFTAMALMILVEEKKVALSDSITKYLKAPNSWKPITIRHLLTHTSGLGDYTDDFNFRKDYTEDDLVKMITATKLAFKPGEKWRYSNLGYVTLGILIRKLSGKFYGDFLQERVFGPLGMTTTRIINEADIIPNRAAGYEMKADQLKNQEWVAPMINTTADGSLYFTVEDLAKWDAALEAGKIVGADSYREMWTPVNLSNGKTAPYGFGWSLDKTTSGHRIIEHGGAWQGFTSQILRYPDDHLSVAVLCNVAGCDSAYIARRIAGIYQPDLGPPAHTAIQLDPSALKPLEGEYQLEDNLKLRVTAEEGKLICMWSSRRHELFPESETMFFEEDSARTFRFLKDASGKVTGMILSVPEEIEFHKLP